MKYHNIFFQSKNLQNQFDTFWDIAEKLYFDPGLTPYLDKPDFSQTCGFHQKKRIIDLY